MTNDTKRDPGQFWDRQFDRQDFRYGRKPNAFVAEELPTLLEPGQSVLCVGDGEGRNGVWCAEQGFVTTSVEPSQVGADKIQQLADERGVSVEVIQARMEEGTVAPESFDAAVLTYVHAPEPMRRTIHAATAAALRPGGVIVLEAFTPAQRKNQRTSGGPPDISLMFTPELLRSDFVDFDIEHLTEVVVELAEGDGHRGPADVVRLVARKTG